MDTIAVKVWMVKNGYTQAQIARELDIIPETVWKTIHNRENHSKVIAWLKQRGAIKEPVVHEEARR